MARPRRGMSRQRLVTLAGLLLALVAFGPMCAPALATEPWYSWKRLVPAPKTPPVPGKQPIVGRPPAHQAATASTATKPTVENRIQHAPVSAGATTEAQANRQTLRTTPIKNPGAKPVPPRTTPPVSVKAPAVVSQDVPPAPAPPLQHAVHEDFVPPNIAGSEHVSAIQTASAVAEPPSRSDAKGVEPKPMWKPRGTEIRTPVKPLTARSQYIGDGSGGLQPVAFAQEQPVPPVPDEAVIPPVPSKQILLPLNDPGTTPKIQLETSATNSELISLTVYDASLSVVLGLLAKQHGLNLVSGGEVEGRVTVTLKDVALDDALNALLTVNGYSWNRSRNILVISKIDKETTSSPELRGVGLRVFRLNYIAADDVERVVQSLISPAGRAVTTIVDSKNTRRTREEIVVEDLPEYLARIEAYIAEVDRPPRQVLIEAHVLQVNLKDDLRHGVDLQEMFDVSGTKVSLQTTGFANPKASPAFFFGIDNNNFHALLEALKTTTDAKTLATPQVLCLNGQHAKIQIGQQLGFLVTTTTQTSTLQNVNFLDVGVVLDVTPTITDDGMVMLQVKPEVSGGQINAAGLPQEDTTEVETTVMLADGSGMIIGGLIKEEDTETQTKIPYLGDVWLAGRLFQRRTVLRQRNEVIIALVPYIMPYPDAATLGMEEGVERARTRLLTPELDRFDRRRWEADLPDAIRNPKIPLNGEIKQRVKDPYATSRPAFVP